MSDWQWSEREQKLLGWLKKQGLSPSHEVDHLKRVAHYAAVLADLYGGERDIVVAASLVHDLGRNKYRGAESAIKGAAMVVEPLSFAGYEEMEIEQISRCVAEHDQPGLQSDFLEARILKDADFLDGFGPWGILRSVMYAGETGGGVQEALERLKEKGRARLEGLEFSASRRLGWRLHRMTELFLSELEQIAEVTTFAYEGKLIVLEGISGCGKDTQATLLAQGLQDVGYEVVIVHHPSDGFKQEIWRKWREHSNEPKEELLILVAERWRVLREHVWSALHAGKIVISTRSGVSAAVYQAEAFESTAWHRFLFAFEPVADVLLFLDVSPEIAFERTGERVEKGEEKDRGFFAVKQGEQRRRYKEELQQYPNVEWIRADGEIENVGKLVWDSVLAALD